jgi:hypothetical protein
MATDELMTTDNLVRHHRTPKCGDRVSNGVGVKLRKIIVWITGTSIEEVRMAFWRGVFWVCFYVATGAVLLGVVAVYNMFGMAAMYAVVFLIVLLAIWTERRRPIYFGDGSEFGLDLGGDTPTLPPPGKQALPAPGAPQISMSKPALTTRQRPALPKRSPK